jgi:hypothetical protein
MNYIDEETEIQEEEIDYINYELQNFLEKNEQENKLYEFLNYFNNNYLNIIKIEKFNKKLNELLENKSKILTTTSYEKEIMDFYLEPDIISYIQKNINIILHKNLTYNNIYNILIKSLSIQQD